MRRGVDGIIDSLYQEWRNQWNSTNVIYSHYAWNIRCVYKKKLKSETKQEEEAEVKKVRIGFGSASVLYLTFTRPVLKNSARYNTDSANVDDLSRHEASNHLISFCFHFTRGNHRIRMFKFDWKTRILYYRVWEYWLFGDRNGETIAFPLIYCEL